MRFKQVLRLVVASKEQKLATDPVEIKSLLLEASLLMGDTCAHMQVKISSKTRHSRIEDEDSIAVRAKLFEFCDSLLSGCNGSITSGADESVTIRIPVSFKTSCINEADIELTEAADISGVSLLPPVQTKQQVTFKQFICDREFSIICVNSDANDL